MNSSQGLVVACLLSIASGCSREVTSEVQAQRAYLGLDTSIEKAITAGFAGFKASGGSANIPDQTVSGNATGTMVISGQVDSGSSANKTMRLNVGMVDYSDGNVEVEGYDPVLIQYDTSTDVALQPDLTLGLQGIPDGTYDGSLVGDYTMAGDVTGTVTLDLSMAGQIESDGTGGTRRAVGTTTVTGTATSSGVEYAVNLTI